MTRLILIITTILFSASIAADADALKMELQNIILDAGFDCNEINQISPTAYNDALSVSCDDTHRYTIRYKAGDYIVKERK